MYLIKMGIRDTFRVPDVSYLLVSIEDNQSLLKVSYNSKDIFDRLNNHSTIQKIMREFYRAEKDKEIYIMLHSVGVKHFNEAILQRYLTTFVTSRKLDRDFKLEEDIDENSMIDMAEALLILHFQPEYNKQSDRFFAGFVLGDRSGKNDPSYGRRKDRNQSEDHHMHL